MNKTYILATKGHDNVFYPSDIGRDLSSYAENLEYADVAVGNYQLWEYPSGRLFLIVPDRKVDEKDQYATPFNRRGAVWLPQLNELGIDEAKVSDAFAKFQNDKS